MTNYGIIDCKRPTLDKEHSKFKSKDLHLCTCCKLTLLGRSQMHLYFWCEYVKIVDSRILAGEVATIPWRLRAYWSTVQELQTRMNIRIPHIFRQGNKAEYFKESLISCSWASVKGGVLFFPYTTVFPTGFFGCRFLRRPTLPVINSFGYYGGLEL